MKDMVVGCITGYTFDKIAPWVNSLDRSGFTGDKVMICYNISYDVAQELANRGYSVLAFEKDDANKTFKFNQPNFNIVVERFFHMWYLLKRYRGQYRNIICTDVKDVVFQSNPSDWLEKNLGDKKINVACESIRYTDEEWGKHNLYKSFGPFIFEENVNNLIFNAGTISGEFDTMIDLFLQIYLMCNGTQRYIEGGGGPDQAALNIILNMKPYKDITRFTMSEEGWAAQLGTTGPQIKGKYGHLLVENRPEFSKIKGLVTTSTGEPFALVHQYDRVPYWKDDIEKKYA